MVTTDPKSRTASRWTALALAALAAAPVAAAPAGSAVDKTAELQRTQTVLQDALKTDPGNSVLWEHLGWTDKQLGDVDGAQAAFEKVTSLDPQDAGAWSMLGLIYEKKKQRDAAANAWKHCLESAQDAHLKELARQHLNHVER